MIGLIARYRYTAMWALYVAYVIAVFQTVEALR